MDALESPLSLSAEDLARMSEVRRATEEGQAGIAQLVERLEEQSWAVRRAVVGALARAGEAALQPLCHVLTDRRDSETRLAAAVDALVAARTSQEGPLFELLGHPNPAVVSDAAQILGRRKSAAAVGKLRELLSHPDANVAVSATEALGRIGGRGAVEALISVLASSDFFRTFPAVDVLGRTGDPIAVGPLAGLLEDPTYAQDAARALGRLGDVAAVQPLARLLLRPSDAMVRIAAEALVQIWSQYRRRFGSAQVVERNFRAGVPADAAIRRLGQSVADAAPEEQQALCQLVGWLRGPMAATALLALLDAAPSAAAEALKHLGREVDDALVLALRHGDSARRVLLLPLIVGKKSAVAECVLCLNDPDPAVRVAACEALARTQDAASVRALFAHLGERDPRVSHAVTAAIQSIASADTEALALAAASGQDERARHEAIRVISYFGYPSGLQLLERAARGEEEKLREVAIGGLPYFDSPSALQTLLDVAAHPSYRTRSAAMRALGQTASEPRVVRTLRAGLKDPDAWVRYYACQSLGRLRHADSVRDIQALLEDSAGHVRAAAVDALARIGTADAFWALQTAAGSGDPDLQRAAFLGLGISRNPAALPLLLAAAGSPDAATRLIVLSALAEFESPQVLPALARAAKDPDEGVRNAAIGHLATWRGPGATQVLIGLLPNPNLEERVIAALAVPIEGRIAGLLGALESADEVSAAWWTSALARMGRPDAAAAIRRALGFPNVAARRAAARALAAVDTAEARSALVQAAEDPDPEVRRFAQTVAH